MVNDKNIFLTVLLWILFLFLSLYFEADLMFYRFVIMTILSFLYPILVHSIRYWKLLSVFVVVALTSNIIGSYSVYMEYRYDKISLFFLMIFAAVIIIILFMSFTLGFVLRKILDKMKNNN